MWFFLSNIDHVNRQATTVGLFFHLDWRATVIALEATNHVVGQFQSFRRHRNNPSIKSGQRVDERMNRPTVPEIPVQNDHQVFE